MRFVLTIILFTSICAKANVYYVSNAGSDNNNGTSTGTSWQTLSKVNGFSFSSGDTVKLKCGDSWNERLVPASNVYYTSYSTGAKPIITGFQTVGSFSQAGNVWTATFTNGVKTLNAVTINGTLGIKARNPNTNYSNSSSATDSTLQTSLTGTPNYTGTELVKRTTRWVTDRAKITGQVVGTLSFSPKLTYDPSSYTYMNGYFLQNNSTFIDVAGEWSFDSTSKSLAVYSTTSPTVQGSSIDTLVYISQKTNVTLDGIAFTGGNQVGILIDTSNNIKATNCTFTNMGTDGIRMHKSHHVTITSNTFQDCLNDGIYGGNTITGQAMTDTCNNANISSNTFRRIAIYSGMASRNNKAAMAVVTYGDSLTFYNNIIDSVGYIPLYTVGRGCIISYNYITNFCLTKEDGGGIQTYIGNGTVFISGYNNGMIIRKNIVGNGIGTSSGWSSRTDGSYIAGGIYLDQNSSGVTVDSNYTFNTYEAGFFNYQATNNTIRNNIFDDSLGHTVRVDGTSGQTSGLVVKNNVINQRASANYNSKYQASNISQTLDSNYYFKTIDSSTMFNWASTTYGFNTFKSTFSGKETNGRAQPIYVRPETVVICNPTLNDSSFSFTRPYLDKDGNYITPNVSFVLRPFESKFLWRTNQFITGRTYLRIR